MRIRIEPHRFTGVVRVPASKSHTIRQLLIASLADGVSEIVNPLDSLDTRSCLAACRGLGAEIEEVCNNGEVIWRVRGFKGEGVPSVRRRDEGQGGQKGQQAFLRELQSYKDGTINPGRLIQICAAPDAYIRHGLPNYNIKLPVSVIEKTTVVKHKVGMDVIENLPELLQSPVMLLKSITEPKAFITLIDAKDKVGNPIFVIQKPTLKHITIIQSIYGKDNFDGFIKNCIEKGMIIIADKNKVIKYVRPQELQLLKGTLLNDLTPIVSQISNDLSSNLDAEIEEVCNNDEVIWLIKGAGDRGQGVEGKREKGKGNDVSNLIFNQQDTHTDKNPLSAARCPLSAIDIGNSGTTLYLALAVAGLQSTPYQFTGDESIQKRSAAPLLEALAEFGVSVDSKNGCAPITVRGPWKGGKAVLPCPTSQYLSAILIAAPCAHRGVVTEIEVPLLNEKPYVEMTLSYLKAHNLQFTMYNAQCTIVSDVPNTGRFVIPGGQAWKPFSSSVPADFSSAAFPAAAAAITGGEVTLLGLDPEDTQGDKYFLEMLREMGCEIQWDIGEARDQGSGVRGQGTVGVVSKSGLEQQETTADKKPIPDPRSLNPNLRPNSVTISRSSKLRGGVFDLNKTPDLLPAAAAVAAYAEGDTEFVNVAHARIKETDRIAVMAKELAKLGVRCTEKDDGLIVHGRGQCTKEGEGRREKGKNSNVSNLNLMQQDTLTNNETVPCSLFPVTCLNGHNDHRVVMALAVAALGANTPVEIEDAEAADVTYPGFLELLVISS